MNWLLVAIIVVTTTVKDILQAIAMRRHGEIHDFRPGALGKALRLLAKAREGPAQARFAKAIDAAIVHACSEEWFVGSRFGGREQSVFDQPLKAHQPGATGEGGG